METKQIVTNSFYKLVYDLQEAMEQGFRLDPNPNNAPAIMGPSYEVNLIKPLDTAPVLIKKPGRPAGKGGK
jgi:hypothetical protein